MARRRSKEVSISLFPFELPLTHPYRLSGGRLLFERLDSTFVRLETDSGIVGWGEGCPWGSSYLPAFPGGIRVAAAELALMHNTDLPSATACSQFGSNGTRLVWFISRPRKC